jgi:hypothetical protein
MNRRIFLGVELIKFFMVVHLYYCVNEVYYKFINLHQINQTT